MLSSITWQQYITYTTVASILYYAFIWLVFFKGKLRFALAGFHQQKGNDREDELLLQSQQVMDEIRPLFEDASTKSVLLASLRKILQKYNGIQAPALQAYLSDAIAHQAQTKCSIRLSEDDLGALWK